MYKRIQHPIYHQPNKENSYMPSLKIKDFIGTRLVYAYSIVPNYHNNQFKTNYVFSDNRNEYEIYFYTNHAVVDTFVPKLRDRRIIDIEMVDKRTLKLHLQNMVDPLIMSFPSNVHLASDAHSRWGVDNLKHDSDIDENGYYKDYPNYEKEN